MSVVCVLSPPSPARLNGPVDAPSPSVRPALFPRCSRPGGGGGSETRAAGSAQHQSARGLSGSGRPAGVPSPLVTGTPAGPAAHRTHRTPVGGGGGSPDGRGRGANQRAVTDSSAIQPQGRSLNLRPPPRRSSVFLRQTHSQSSCPTILEPQTSRA